MTRIGAFILALVVRRSPSPGRAWGSRCPASVAFGSDVKELITKLGSDDVDTARPGRCPRRVPPEPYVRG